MIELTPIDERIQKRLFQKMELLSRRKNVPNESTNGLSLQKLSNKTTFIRMTSQQDVPVVLMGGELSHTGINEVGTYNGYNEIYGPRNDFNEVTLIDPETYELESSNKFKRPIPGVKSIDVEFKGGVRALREATISWTCWSFDDIDRLSPHFLAHGKTVVLEWGWVYDKTTLRNLPPLTGASGVKKSAYENYNDKVTEANGDFDYMVGIVKNFEYTTREDGAFDCQTVITSVGTSILSNDTPNQVAETTSAISKLTKNEELEKLKEVIKKEDEQIINFDVGVSLKSMIAHIDSYIGTLCKQSEINNGNVIDKPVIDLESRQQVKPQVGQIQYSPNKFIRAGKQFGYGVYDKVDGVWVRWGWFEDNILSKFLTLVSTSPEKQFITQFRSVEKTNDGFESTRIRTHKFLETVDINKYILPGKFKTFELKDVTTFKMGVPFVTERGDKPLHIEMANIINDNGIFKSFENKNREYGRMRNMLINTKILRDAFGVEANKVSTEPINLKESFDELFRLLNQDIPFWTFEVTQDSQDAFRTKIIDKQQTAVKFEVKKKINQTFLKDEGTKSTYNPSTDEVTNNGVFFFPVWQTNSIVKSQNVITKIPDAFAISAMYGSNYDDVKFLDTQPLEANSLETMALASAYAQNEDKNLKNIDIALRQSGYQKIGQTDDTKEITIDGGDDNLITFINNKADLIKKKYEERIKEINKQLTSEAKATRDKNISKAERRVAIFQAELNNKPFPTPDSLRDNPETTDKFNTLIKKGYFADVYDRKFYDDGRMKQTFIDFISNSVSVTPDKVSSDKAKPLLIPMDMEIEIEGIGGIVPGNSYHSTYLPSRYQEEAMFQVFDVGHKVDSSGWSVTIAGLMRSSFAKLSNSNKKVELDKIVDDLFKAKRDADDAKKFLDQKKLQQQNIELRDKKKRYEERGRAAAERIGSRS